MLQEFTVDNFKSLINVTFRPHDRNLVLGKNNTGKTNLCQAITFLANTASLSLDQAADAAAGGRFNLTNQYFQKKEIDFRVRATVPFQSENLSFEYLLSLSVRWSPMTTPALEVESEFLRVAGDGFDGVTLVENTRQGVKLLHEVEHTRGHTKYAETSAPRDTTMLQRLYDLETNPRANCFKRYLSSWQYYALSADALRSYAHSPNQTVLFTNGSNLASVIFHLKTTNERQYRRLLANLRVIEPNVEIINFVVASQEAIFMVFEDSRGNRIPASSASAGTLRFLALGYVLLSQPSFMTPGLILVEEPENGLYVGYLRRLLEMLGEGPEQPQVVFTSHSPYFIDLFDDRLESVFVMKRGAEHASIVQPDIQSTRKRLEKFSLGEQHFREMLG